MGSMESLGKRRAFEANDSSKWTPVELLEYMVEAVKTGSVKPIRIVVLYVEEAQTGDGRSALTHYWITSKSSFESTIAMLHVALRRVTDVFMR